MNLPLPDPSLVLLVGPAGVGKSTFARRHFRPTEMLSSDFFRGMACDDESDQSASGAAFSLLHHAADVRLGRNRFTVVDATNLQADARRPLLEVARRRHFQTAAIIFALPESVCRDRDAARAGRVVGPDVVRQHVQQLQQGLGRLHKEGHAVVHVLSSPQEVESAVIERRPLPVDRRLECGPFDLIGDVHGCFGELTALLGLLGYQISATTDAPAGRTTSSRRRRRAARRCSSATWWTAAPTPPACCAWRRQWCATGSLCAWPATTTTS